jgi:Domain of unknown function (DUF4153)
MRVPLPLVRAAIGLAQGIALYLLYCTHAATPPLWPATDGFVFAPLVLIAVFIPTLAIAAVGNLRTLTFNVWIAVATLLVLGLGIYDIYRDPGPGFGQTLPRNIAHPAVWIGIAAVLFIGEAMVVSGDTDRRYLASYARYFDTASKQAVQAVLAGAFVAAFWAVLVLGAALFKLLNIEFFVELLQREWFAIPATTLAAACALHVTDVSAGIVRGVRTLGLTLLSWLLPMMVVIAVAFLATLVFTGLEPLWKTRYATTVVLFAAAGLALLINATYQDGQREQPVNRLLHYAGTIAALALVPLVVIAARAVMLRVDQYGWTPERIVAAACVAVAACLATGYGVAAVPRGPWLKRIELTNVFAAMVTVAMILALASPIVDPARIATNDQVARLETGLIAPNKFDFAFLRFRSGRFGRDVLDRLTAKRDGPDAALIADKARTAQAAKTMAELQSPRPVAPTAAERGANIVVVYPKGEALPRDFAEQNWNDLPDQFRYPTCLTAHFKCAALLVDLDGDGKAEIIIVGASYQLVTAYKEADGKWSLIGTLAASNCKGVQDALRKGDVEILMPELKELRAGGLRLAVVPSCPPDAAQPRAAAGPVRIGK